MSDIFLDIQELDKAKGMPFEDGVLHAALCYVKAGIPVLPLEPNSKKLPSGSTGINYLSATRKVATAEKWFGPEGKFRGYNIGIGCGMKGGVMALDVDAKPVGGTTGLKEVAKIVSKEGPLPHGPRQATPSGGYHYLYEWQDNAASSSSKIANGIDTRGGTAERCTGHIVAFPSTFNGKAYVWEEGGEVPPMPSWASEALGQPWREKKKDESVKAEIPSSQINRMLTIIDPDSLSYEDWVKVGMALKSACGEDGLDLWDEWSSGGSRRKAGECGFRWKSFDEDGPVGFGTLLFMAKEAGWRPLPGDVSNPSVDAEVEERVLQMNKKYALVRAGKSAMVATFDGNSVGEKVGFLSIASFGVMAANIKIQMPTRSGFIEKPMGEIWMASEHRREYFDVGIYPQDNEPPGVLNLWNGWGVKPDSEKSCEKYLSHMRDVVCSGDSGIYEWLLDWMADAVQNSRDLKGTCIVLRGIEGCGKGMWADQFGKLFGKHYAHLIDAERLTTKFNSLTSDSVLVFADEVLWPGDRKAANILKGLVTERRITKESKGVDSIEVDNLAHVVIASNEDWIIPAGPQSRRWLVLNCSPAMANNKKYFDSLVAEMDNGGREALLALLQERKIISNLRLAPVTQGLIEQRRLSHRHDSLLQFLTEHVQRGSFATLDARHMVGEEAGWPGEVLKYELFAEYRTWCKDTRIPAVDTLSMSVFSAKIVEYGFEESEKMLKVPGIYELLGQTDLKQGVRRAV